ncbi:MAG: hypothetical protein H7Y89_12290 [Steroidobacteraceae bacterium]|nr:hypothetical protein [Steroidobacteraceae bacterium]
MELRLTGWQATIDPETLLTTASIDNQTVYLSSPAASPYDIADLVVSSSHATWSLTKPKIDVTVEARGSRLHMRFSAEGDERIEWPLTTDSNASALILPEGSGLYIPLDDPAWRARLKGYCASLSGGLHMPFWSYRVGARTLTYFVASDLRSELCLRDRGGRIGADLVHEFQARDGRRIHEIDIGFGDGSPIAPALEYRARLDAAGKLPTLAQKAAVNPGIAKLAGAVHMYTWGDGREPAFIADLVNLGVKRAWIGYDQDPDGEQKVLAGREYIAAARNAGFLVGPYDTYNNAQDPKIGEDFVSRWPETIYPDGCIVNRDGKPRLGFAGRGCELSSEAMRRVEPTLAPIAKRLDSMLVDGANSYFLDVDAFGELHDDWSPAHPMTVFQDQANRLARLRVARDRGIVLGSEEGVAWSLALVDFVHGAGGTRNAAIWAEPKGTYGKWWPPDRPGFFFMPMEPPSESFRASRYDATFRVPLYAAAFHDAVVATDRWDVPMNKYPSIASTRQLIELLYGTPSIWAMDRQVLSDWREPFVALQKFFGPLHGRIATRRLTAFEWLTPDRRVQRTRFEDVVEITANFSDEKFADAPAGCLSARWLTENRVKVFCPVPPGPQTRKWTPGRSGMK